MECLFFCRRLLLILIYANAALAGDGPATAFREVTDRLGIDFRHFDGRSGERYYVETTGAGGGWFDYDADGDSDLYLINGAPTPGTKPGPIPRNLLYENRDGVFIDVTEKTGLGDTGYGMGMCSGDYDGDGLLDLFVTNYGPDRLFRNKGDGSFEEVAERAGVAGKAWGTNCAFGDVDGDGDLDLYVANYVDFRYEANPKCGGATRNIQSYCRPSVFKGLDDYLYINRGDGTFSEESRRRGIRQNGEVKSFGVLLCDIDEDGDSDILVASDGTMNRLYINDGKGSFSDESLLSGFGFNAAGEAEAGMGVALGDVNADGRPDLFVTNYSGESNTLMLNRGELFFEDATHGVGLSQPSLREVGWGTQLFDYDNDGDLDLAIANGHVIDNIAILEAGASYPQRNQLFANNGQGSFSPLAEAGGFQIEAVSRALAVADWDRDGRLDLLVTNSNSAPNLLHNVLKTANHWIGLELRGPPANRFAIGARVTASAGLHKAWRQVCSGGSFLTQSELALHFGLGSYSGPVALEILWPDGRKQLLTLQKLDRYHRIDYPQ